MHIQRSEFRILKSTIESPNIKNKYNIYEIYKLGYNNNRLVEFRPANDCINGFTREELKENYIKLAEAFKHKIIPMQRLINEINNVK